MTTAKTSWYPGCHLTAQITRLVTELRFYLGGNNYASGRYAGTHAMLFTLEQALRELDLDGGLAFREEHGGFAVAELMWELSRAADRVGELVDAMKSTVVMAGCDGGPATAAAQQAAVAAWLAANRVHFVRMNIEIEQLVSFCVRGQPILAMARYSKAESEYLNNLNKEEPVVKVGTFAKFARKTKCRLRRLFRR